MPTILITGASRGIGLEFARQYAALGWRVIATCRDPAGADQLGALATAHDQVAIHRLDVTDAAGIDALAAALAGQPIDVLLNNAGITLPRPAQSFGATDYAGWRQVLEVNLLAPQRISEAFVDHVGRSDWKLIVAIGSTMGAFSRSFGGAHVYRTSKAALHMAMQTMARDLAPRGIAVALLSPGVVDTDFTRATDTPKISAADSVGALIPIIAQVAQDRSLSGSFLRYTGETVAW